MLECNIAAVEINIKVFWIRRVLPVGEAAIGKACRRRFLDSVEGQVAYKYQYESRPETGCTYPFTAEINELGTSAAASLATST